MWGGVAAVCLLTGVIAMSAPGRADTIQLYAAGSLRAALTEVAKSFEAQTRTNVQAEQQIVQLPESIAVGADYGLSP